MKISLLLDALKDLLEKGFVDKLFDAAYRKVRHIVLSVARVAEGVEGVEDILFQVIECLGLILHAKPEHPWRVVAAEDASAVEVHGEGLMPLSHLLASLDDLGDVLIGRIAHKFQGKMYLIGLAPVDVAALVFQIALETLYQGGIFVTYRDGDG